MTNIAIKLNNNNQITTSGKDKDSGSGSSWLKMFFVLLPLVIILAACGGDPSSSSSGTPDTPELCKTDPTAKGCPDYQPPSLNCTPDPTIIGCEAELAKVCDANALTAGCPRVVNSFLANAGPGDAAVANYLIRANSIIITASKVGRSISAAPVYGALTTPLTESYEPTDIASKFTEATGDDLNDNSKNNIIKLATGTDTEETSEIYYYSHKDGKQFTQFLPAINKMEILALNYNAATNQPTVIKPDQQANLEAPTPERELKTHLLATKGRTYKGLANVMFGHDSADSGFFSEKKIYPATFSLTINAIFDAIAAKNDNHFDLKVDLLQAPQENSSDVTNGKILKVAAKSIELTSLSHNTQSFRVKVLDSTTEYLYFRHSTGNSNIAFSHDNNQIAGNITTFTGQNFEVDGTFYKKYILLSFASNEWCQSSANGDDIPADAGCTATFQ